MTALLVITCGLLLVSGGVKLRSGRRARLGLQPLSLIELLLAALLGWAASAGLGQTPAAGVLVPSGVILVLASSLIFSSRVRAVRRQREETEARRLETYVKYFADVDDLKKGGADED